MTLQKWSSKIQAVTPANLLPSTRNAFRTNRNQYLKPLTLLIEESLSDNSKLVSRTRIRRGDPRIDQVVDGAYSNVDVEGKPLLKEEHELFDDTDFYQQLLREVIDGQAANGYYLIKLLLQRHRSQFLDYAADDLEGRKKRVKKQVDTRASKGRKLR
jgi:protein AATF/BFR2